MSIFDAKKYEDLSNDEIERVTSTDGDDWLVCANVRAIETAQWGRLNPELEMSPGGCFGALKPRNAGMDRMLKAGCEYQIHVCRQFESLFADTGDIVKYRLAFWPRKRRGGDIIFSGGSWELGENRGPLLPGDDDGHFTVGYQDIGFLMERLEVLECIDGFKEAMERSTENEKAT